MTISTALEYCLQNRPQCLLQDMPQPKFAYSTRLLCPSYNGPCMLLVRSSDSAEALFGFVNGELDTAGILRFAGASTNIFMKTWFDQSGNGRNVTAASSYPRIGGSGALSTLNGHPSVTYNGTTELKIGDLNTNMLPVGVEDIFAVVNVTNFTVGRTVIGGSTDAGPLQFRVDITTGFMTLVKQNTAVIGTSTSALSTGVSASVHASYDATNYAFHLNGADAGSGTGAQTVTTTGMQFGVNGAAAVQPMIGHIPEVIVFSQEGPTIFPLGMIQKIAADHKAYWGTP